MSVIPVGYGEATVRINTVAQGGPAYVVFGYEVGIGSDATASATNIADTLNNNPGLPTFLVTTYVIDEVVVRQNDGDPFLATATASVNAPGLFGSSPASPQVSTLIQKLTGFAGKQARGRMYVPGLNRDEISVTGTIGSTRLSQLQTAADQFLIDLTTNGCPMVLLHTSPAVPPTVVTSLNVDDLVATQRRRLR